MADLKTMKAVVFDGPRNVSVRDRPVPQGEPRRLVPPLVQVVLTCPVVQHPDDIVVKVQAAALCGS